MINKTGPATPTPIQTGVRSSVKETHNKENEHQKEAHTILIQGKHTSAFERSITNNIFLFVLCEPQMSTGRQYEQ